MKEFANGNFFYSIDFFYENVNRAKKNFIAFSPRWINMLKTTHNYANVTKYITVLELQNQSRAAVSE